MSKRDKWVRRFTVDETARHNNGFTIYKITSILFPIESPEAVTVVSVWKRYSDVQLLHKNMHSLHAGLHLRGNFPTLPKYSFFKRFQPQVIQERANTIKQLLEFIAEHKLLFTSTDFVNFLQTGYPEPKQSTDSSGVINAIRSSLHLPIEEIPPLEYQTSDDDSRSPQHTARPTTENVIRPQTIDKIDNISQIPIYEAAEVEIIMSPKNEPIPQTLSKADSFNSINSLESINSDLFDDINKLTIEKSTSFVKSKSVLPDLINFDAPSTSKFEDYHTMPKLNNSNMDSETLSVNSTFYGSTTSVNDDRRSSRMSTYSKSSYPSVSNLDSRTRTEVSYVFEAGYLLNMGARSEDTGEYQKAFEYYKSGIEKMLIGVQTDTDGQRRAMIKEKINKYLSYAEDIFKNHLCDTERSLLPERDETTSLAIHCPLPISMLRHSTEELACYQVLAVLSNTIMLVLHKSDNECYAMKVIQKIPNNLTEFDEYFLQHTQETRTPIMPTNIPYMVPLISYIETNNLIFLILKYAPGKQILDYINNYVKSVPNTPAREVNLENVFIEPIKSKPVREVKIENEYKEPFKSKNVDKINENIANDDINIIEHRNNNINNIDDEKTDDLDNSDVSVNDLVKNSQRLLYKVDKVLNDESSDVIVSEENSLVSDVVIERDAIKIIRTEDRDGDVGNGKIERRNVVTPIFNKLSVRPRDVLPPSTVCKWGAEILTALESLHNSGVVCRDLNPTNILLGQDGQIILTYMYAYPGLDMSLSKIRANPSSMYIAPELFINTVLDDAEEAFGVCDLWSFGAVMYEILCGVPLSYYHRSMFTSHTILQLPEGLTVEEQSLLTQLLTYEPTERLGAGADGIQEIKRHPYFKHIDWQHVYRSWVVPN